MKKIILFISIIASVMFANAQNVIQGEYFIDTDPGFGLAHPFQINFPDSEIIQSFNIPFIDFPNPGFHYVFTRVLDNSGSWSITTRRSVQVDDTLSDTHVIKVEYFFSNNPDNGFGNNYFKLLAPASDSSWIFNIDSTQVPAGWSLANHDTLFLRVQSDDLLNSWSLTTMIDSINISTDFEELEKLLGITIFPNPFQNQISIISKENVKMRFLIYNTNGQLVVDKSINGNSVINTQDLSPGVYTLFIRSEWNKIYKSTLIKQ